MAHNLVEADTYTTNVVVPDDGDTASAASVEAGFQDLADRTNWIANRMLPAAGITRQLALIPLLNTSATYAFATAGAAPYTWLAGAARGDMVFQIPYQPGAGIVSVTATHRPSAGAFAAAATLSALSLVSYTISTATEAVVDTQADPAGAAGAYDILHSFTLTCAATRDMTSDVFYYLRWLEDDSGVANGELVGITYVVEPS